MKIITLTLATMLSLTAVNADCRKDTIYKNTIENGITYPQKRTINTYNSNNKIIQFIEQNWNSGTKIYDNDARTSYTFNNDGYKIESVIENWSSNNWVNEFKYSYSYNSKNQITQNFSNKWNNTALKWEDYTKYVVTYTSKYKIGISSNWNYYGNNTWDARYKDSTLFNNYQKDSLHSRYSWDNITKTWEPMSLYKYTYNSQQDLETETELDWNINKWENWRKTTYTYNSNHQIKEELAENYNGPSGIYIDYRITYSYNTSNNIIIKLEEDWDPDNSVWINYNKEVYSYDGNDNLYSKSEFLGWDKTLNEFTLELREDYKCTNISGIQTFSQINGSIHPNPLNSEILHIVSSNSQKFYIYNFAGKVMLTGDLVSGENTVTIPENIGNGMYCLKIGKEVHTVLIQQ
ncbi:MAG: T9SS type A sorting domain-containing protein [Bacteroidia bacterium]|nr:T9SS type A sorting domain-containing protein [Bacteroidia bacterium]